MDAKRADHVSTEGRYAAIREVVYQRTKEQFPGISAQAITQRTAVLADGWKSGSGAQGRPFQSEWSWMDSIKHFRNRPNRFEICLWRGNTLGALCFGQTSRAGSRVRLDLIGSSPARPHVLGVAALPMISYASSVFAALVGASEIWILDPYTELEGYYQDGGFSGRMPYHRGRMGQRRIL